MQARSAVMGKIHEALADGTFHADEVKVLEEMCVLQPQFDGQCAFDDVNVGTVSSPLLQKQDFGDLSTEQMSGREGVEQERRCWTETSCTLLRGRPVPVRLEGIVANQVD